MRQLKISNSITIRESPSLEKYLQEIGKVELITAEEEVVLSRLIKLGDQKALIRLTKANLRFVVSVAKQYQNQGLSLPDLIEEGNLGLIKAAQRFDETKGFKFISYGVWWIRQTIMQAIVEHSRIVRVPLNKVGINNKIGKAFSHLEQELERSPSDEELAELLKIEVSEVSESFGNSLRHASIDAPFSQEQEGNLLDVLENQNAESTDRKMIFQESLKTEIGRALSCLTPRQQEVIKLYYGLHLDHPASLEDISAHFRITRERVRQIKDQALNKLRANCHTFKLLKAYLGG